MIAFVSRSAKRMVCVGVLFAAAAGIAYAAIPDSNGVYTACMLDKVGTVRLIDPSLPASNLMSHCTNVETRFTFNQQGQQGPPGLPGAPCKDGAPGANGKDGADGKDGQPFSGTFTSPNGQFSITVDDTGIKLAGPSNSIELKPDGTIETRTDTSFDLTSGGATNLVAGSSLNLQSGGATSLVAGSSLSAASGTATTLDADSLNVQTSKAATLSVGTNLNASITGAANVVATSLDLKATGTAILEAAGPLALKGSVINTN
ncbi:MAG: hypothetical protein ACXVR0_00365 [Solirubrobacteraceae bacterium]